MTASHSSETAVVVGGTSGLGLTAASLFANEGFQVVVGSHDRDRLANAPSVIGSAARALAVDIRDNSSVKAFFEEIGPFHHLVVTASSALPDRPLDELLIEDLKTFAETKLWGALRCVKFSQSYLQPRGSITFVSGAVSRKGRAASHAKAITNSALEALTRSLAVELGPRARVNCISPGLFDSKGTMAAERRDEIAKLYPLRYVGDAKDVSGLILAVALNSFMTGSVVYVDGGWTAA